MMCLRGKMMHSKNKPHGPCITQIMLLCVLLSGAHFIVPDAWCDETETAPPRTGVGETGVLEPQPRTQNSELRTQSAVSVTATGRSAVSADDAVAQALRGAVRQAVGLLIHEETIIENFSLVRETIYARSAGYIRSYRILQETKAGDVWTAEVQAECLSGEINDDLLAVGALIERAGRPQFTVEISRETPQQTALWVNAALSRSLAQAGITVLQNSRTQDDTKPANLAAYRIVVDGSETSNTRMVSNISLTTSAVEIAISAGTADTGELIGTSTGRGRGASRTIDGEPVRQAAEEAVEQAFPRLLDDILKHWTRTLDTGSTITVRTSGFDNKMFFDAADALRSLDGISRVIIVRTDDGGEGMLRLISRLSAADLARQISIKAVPGARVDVAGPHLITIAVEE